MIFSVVLCLIVSQFTKVKDEKQVEEAFACYTK